MRHAFRHLGLVPTTDQRAIKRAYAARLKQTRPEDDPDAFQALQQCYEQALDWARRQARIDAEAAAEVEEEAQRTAEEEAPAHTPLWSSAAPAPGGTTELPAAVSAPLVTVQDQPGPTWNPPVWTLPPEPAPTPLVPALTIVDEPPVVRAPPVSIGGEAPSPIQGRPPVIIADAPLPPAPRRQLQQSKLPPSRAARRATPVVDLTALARQVCEHAFHSGLVDWLEAHPHLLDLGQRDRLGELLAGQLDALDVLPEAPQMAALAEFFGWEPLNAAPLVRRLLARAAVQAQLDEEAALPFAYQDEQRLRRDQARLLRGSYVARSHYRHALFPSHVRQMHARLSRLDVDSERQLDRLIDPQALAFWSQLVDDRLNSTRVRLYLLRALLAALPPALVGALRAGPQAFLLAWAGFFAGFQVLLWTMLGLRVARRNTLRWVHYWRSPRGDALLALCALVLPALGWWWHDTGFEVPIRFGGWFLLIFGLGPRRAIPLVVTGLAWLFPWPTAWSPWAPTLAPYAAILGTLLSDRMVARLVRIDIERVHLSGWYGCWALLPALLACAIAGVG